MAKAESALVYDVFRVSLGWCAAASGEHGVCAFVLPINSAQIAEAGILALTAQMLPEGASAPQRAPSALKRLAGAAAVYFEGGTVSFDEFWVDFSSGTSFQRRIWSVIARIPYGEVRTYRSLGVETGQPEAAHAIGQAVGANPVPLLVPCHRVVGSDGSLVGFSAEGGLDLKLKMLELEKVPLRQVGNEWRVIV
jgi:O-6-methylguanine DNA methyltransferase